jgi:hypothetical protein
MSMGLGVSMNLMMRLGGVSMMMMLLLLVLLGRVRMMLKAHMSKRQAWVRNRHYRSRCSHCVERIARQSHRSRHSSMLRVRGRLRDGEQHVYMAIVGIWSDKIVRHASSVTGPRDSRAKLSTNLARVEGCGDRAELADGVFQHLVLLLEQLVFLLEILKGRGMALTVLALGQFSTFSAGLLEGWAPSAVCVLVFDMKKKNSMIMDTYM